MLGFVKLWDGFGFLVPIIAIIGFCLGLGIMDLIYGAEYCSQKPWTRIVASWVPSLPLWLIGSALFRTSSRATPDERSHEPYQSGHDTFLFLQFRHWAILVPALYASLEVLVAIVPDPDGADKPQVSTQSDQITQRFLPLPNPRIDLAELFCGEVGVVAAEVAGTGALKMVGEVEGCPVFT